MLLKEGTRDETNMTGAKQAEFKIAVNAHSFQILFKKLYSDPVLAVMRELSCNAWDSHVAAGNEGTPFQVTMPTMANAQFTIRDYGLGLTEEEVFSLYTTVFESTKVGDDVATGGFGLGSKSPFAVVDQFTVTTYDGSTARVYVATLDGGIPKLVEMSTYPDDEPRGVKVSVPCADPSAWKTAGRVWRVFGPFHGKVLIDGRPGPRLADITSIDSPKAIIRRQELNRERSYVLIRNVLYEWAGGAQWTLRWNVKGKSLAVSPKGFIIEPKFVTGFVPPSNRETLEEDVTIPTRNGNVSITECLLSPIEPDIDRMDTLMTEWALKTRPRATFAKDYIDLTRRRQAIAVQGMPSIAYIEKILPYTQFGHEEVLIVSGPKDVLPASALADLGRMAQASWLDPKSEKAHLVDRAFDDRFAIRRSSHRSSLTSLAVVTQDLVDEFAAWGFNLRTFERPEKLKGQPRAKKVQSATERSPKSYARMWSSANSGVPSRDADLSEAARADLGGKGYFDMTLTELLANKVVVVPLTSMSSVAVSNHRENSTVRIIDPGPLGQKFYYYPFDDRRFNIPVVAFIGPAEWKATDPDEKKAVIDALELMFRDMLRDHITYVSTQMSKTGQVHQQYWLLTEAGHRNGGALSDDAFAGIGLYDEMKRVRALWKSLAPLAVPGDADGNEIIKYQKEKLSGLTLSEFIQANLKKDLI